jgi:hypothetical protein
MFLTWALLMAHNDSRDVAELFASLHRDSRWASGMKAETEPDCSAAYFANTSCASLD